jgi:hypothetical protein
LNENKKGLGRQIMRLIVRTSAALAAVVTVCCAAGPPITQAQQKSNVIVIMSDDVGWGDLGAYGGETRGAPTPNLDREPVQRDVEKVSEHSNDSSLGIDRCEFAGVHQAEPGPGAEVTAEPANKTDGLGLDLTV